MVNFKYKQNTRLQYHSRGWQRHHSNSYQICFFKPFVLLWLIKLKDNINFDCDEACPNLSEDGSW